MRTQTTKEVHKLRYEKLSTWSIIDGALREIYSRYDTEIFATIAFGLLAIEIYQKLGK